MAQLKHPAESGWTLPAPVYALLCASLGVIATYAALQLWSAMGNAEQPLLWWAGRALGFVAYLALWMSMVFGVLASAGGFGGRFSRKWIMDLHQEWTLSAVVATVLHVVVLVTHPDSRITPWAAIIPFASERLTGEMAMGTVGLLGLGVIAISSWLRTRIPYVAWRAIHALSFGVMIVALAHSILAGTDTEAAWASWLYITTAIALSVAIVLRVVVSVDKPRELV